MHLLFLSSFHPKGAFSVENSTVMFTFPWSDPLVKHLSIHWNCLFWLSWCSQSCTGTAPVLVLLSTFPFADTCVKAGHNDFSHCTGFSVPPFCCSLVNCVSALKTGWCQITYFIAGCESICGPVPHLFIQWPGELSLWLAGACQENYCSI